LDVYTRDKSRTSSFADNEVQKQQENEDYVPAAYV
jgi:hypothetical protein